MYIMKAPIRRDVSYKNVLLGLARALRSIDASAPAGCVEGFVLTPNSNSCHKHSFKHELCFETRTPCYPQGTAVVYKHTRFKCELFQGSGLCFLRFVIFASSEMEGKHISQVVWVKVVSSRLNRTFPQGERYIFSSACHSLTVSCLCSWTFFLCLFLSMLP